MEFNDNPNHPSLRVHDFGDLETSDVTFVIGTDEFKCHKKVLVDSSEVFRAMFCSGFREKYQPRVSLQEEPDLFKNLLSIIYTGQLDDWEQMFISLCCKKSYSQCDLPHKGVDGVGPCCVTTKVWCRCTSLLQLADKYDVLEKAITVLENYFHWHLKRTWSCCCEAILLYIGILYSMDKLKGLRDDCIFYAAKAISTLKEVRPDLVFEPVHLERIMNLHLDFDASLDFIVERQEEFNATSLEPIIHKFGIEELSDVTFIIGRHHFKCHKMSLASRSNYFRNMLYPNNNEISPGVMNLDEDPVAFSHMMDILYTGSFFGWRRVIGCYESHQNILYGSKNAPSNDVCPAIPKLWHTCCSLVKLADKFDVREPVVSFLEACFMRNVGFVPTKNLGNLCSCIGAKHIFAAVHGLYEYKKFNYVESSAVARAASIIKKLDPKLTFDLDTFEQLLTNVVDIY